MHAYDTTCSSRSVLGLEANSGAGEPSTSVTRRTETASYQAGALMMLELERQRAVSHFNAILMPARSELYIPSALLQRATYTHHPTPCVPIMWPFSPNQGIPTVTLEEAGVLGYPAAPLDAHTYDYIIVGGMNYCPILPMI